MGQPGVETSPPTLSICVPVHRRHAAPNLTTLLNDLPAAAGGASYEVIVVLNGISAVDAGAPQAVRLIRHDRNRGVPVAWNAAAAAASGDVLIVVNDDVRVGQGALRLLADALQTDRSIGVAGPVGTHWDISVPQHLEYIDTSGVAPGTAVDCEVLSGFLLATPRTVWKELGGFDEAYSPCGFEEVDYCTAVRLRLGLRCCCVAGVPCKHEFGVSALRPWRRIRWDDRSERLGSIAQRNREYFQAKWRGIDAS